MVERLGSLTEDDSGALEVSKEDYKELKVIKEATDENNTRQSAKFWGLNKGESLESYEFSDSTPTEQQPRKNTDYLNKKESDNVLQQKSSSGEDSSHFHLNLNSTEGPSKKNS